ncbi:arsenate reductase [Cohaesibacter sp. CAU 1516]|uniref:ArsC/Spx/MgsR family protein n=1 Tax=Cohaesibacter sp. CAU 1516 TaxID=2576038 RepID=UPI0010FDEC54|nr:ArsC/Spx/MgsR family protein [Cohaesibacter sp. CAU 1516]TLP43775.1 arsenate reductase [Cohaesibacter sp. CAU 1516]
MKFYGLKSCDTCRKALKSFEAAGKPVTFVDLRADGFSEDDLDRWLGAAGWEVLLNRRSTTWRDLPEGDKADPDEAKARALILQHPTLIKRPVFDDGTQIVVGFGKAQQMTLLG